MRDRDTDGRGSRVPSAEILRACLLGRAAYAWVVAVAALANVHI